jgi:methyl-accepting chemotaxis protein
MKKRSSLERKMLSYFGLIAAASLLISIEFILAIRQAEINANTFSTLNMGPQETIAAVIQGLEWLGSKALLMCGVQVVVTFIVLIMFIRRITGPLQDMVERAEIISAGDLTQTVHVPGTDEIALLAETINGLTSNIQEIVQLALVNDEAMRSSLEDLKQQINGNAEVQRSISHMESKLDLLKDFLGEFKLLLPPPSNVSENANTV